MVAMPLAHVSWALADNALRPACDAFFIDVFGAETAYEMLITPETEAMGLDREERLMLVGDAMLIPIAAAGRGAAADSPVGGMLRRSAGPGRWLGVSLRVACLPDAARWFEARGFALHWDPGMEGHYFLIGRKQAMGLRIEVMQGTLPGDKRLDASWHPAPHPLGIEGLQSIGVSAPSLSAAHDLFTGRLDWPEVAGRELAEEGAVCASFRMGDTVLEAMVPASPEGPLAAHLADIQGICCLTFKVRSDAAARRYLTERGLPLIEGAAGRFAIAPEAAQGRLIWLTEDTPEGYPPVGSNIREPAVFPAP